jgi:hypothetical protein
MWLVQEIDNDNDGTKLTVETHESDNEVISETQLTVALSRGYASSMGVLASKLVDNEFDDVVQHDLEVLKQFWAEEDNAKEKQFTLVVSKN